MTSEERAQKISYWSCVTTLIWFRLETVGGVFPKPWIPDFKSENFPDFGIQNISYLLGMQVQSFNWVKKYPALKICSIVIYVLPYYSPSVLFSAKLIDVFIQFQIGAVSASEEFRLGVSLNADLKRKFENLCVWFWSFYLERLFLGKWSKRRKREK